MHATHSIWRPVVLGAPGLTVFLFILLAATMGRAESARREPKSAPPASTGGDYLQPEKGATIAEIVSRHKVKSDQLASQFRADKEGYPGSLFGFIRDSHRIDQERRSELARLLTPEELEDFEFEECSIGTMVRYLFHDSDVTQGFS